MLLCIYRTVSPKVVDTCVLALLDWINGIDEIVRRLSSVAVSQLALNLMR